MIKNKIVKITKKNQFNKGWTLFKPILSYHIKSFDYRELSFTDIKKAITYADKIIIVLKEKCLSSQIIREIEWVKKNYSLKIELNIKDKKIAKQFYGINIDEIKVNSSISFNYIKVNGRYNLNFLINDKVYNVHESFNETVLYNNKDSKLDFLKNIKSIFLVDKDNESLFNLLDDFKKQQTEINYLISSKSFSKSHFDFAKQNNINLLTSEYVSGHSFFVDDKNRLFGLLPLKNGNYIPYHVKDSHAFFDPLFKSCFYDDNLESDKLTNDLYTVYDRKIQKLSIKDVHHIKKEIDIKLMDNFFNNEFDNSICEKHNDYSNISKSVEYEFTLIPPIFDNTYNESKIYDNIHCLFKEWESVQIKNADEIIAQYKEILSQEYGLISLLESAKNFTTKMSKMINAIDYKGYYGELDETLMSFETTRDNLTHILIKMFNDIDSVRQNEIDNKFDKRIKEYQQIIDVKESEIKNNIKVHENKQSVKILKEQLNKEIELKNKFVSKFDIMKKEKKGNLLKHFDDILKKTNKTRKNNESIENIVNVKDKPNEVKYEIFINKYLYKINEFINKGIIVLNKLKSEKIPTTHSVYEKNGQRFIVIDSKEEFDSVKTIREEFNLHCLTKRGS